MLPNTAAGSPLSPQKSSTRLAPVVSRFRILTWAEEKWRLSNRLSTRNAGERATLQSTGIPLMTPMAPSSMELSSQCVERRLPFCPSIARKDRLLSGIRCVATRQQRSATDPTLLGATVIRPPLRRLIGHACDGVARSRHRLRSVKDSFRAGSYYAIAIRNRKKIFCQIHLIVFGNVRASSPWHAWHFP
jgi:hypothetical protein